LLAGNLNLKLVIVHFLDLVARFAGLAAFAGEAAFLAAVAAGFFVLKRKK
jgi:hypothetical protein